ncbi:M20/M25/M40 family metallo-hydrolase [Aureimonas altamirensis]|uniref:M20/M25/M40 family metallo-hydrolase n=1 Tax=Aureimonas altamirensis TaxID=370622 RepID=UPI001E585161|nr:M20/M25/M40 family metallo-hydrolase [Aureimonas altamirensis]UHD43806.1 M20/M25/M40 family metallo-hydrolase [Aureimonas altamirensis]
MSLDPAQDGLADLFDLLRIPSHAGNPEARRASALACERLLAKAGFETVLAGPSDAPAVVAMLGGSGPERLVFYNHHDVMPPGDLTSWDRDPFKPRIEGDRLWARGASDHKASFVARLAAVRRLNAQDRLPVGITFLIDGEEEIGSPSLEAIILAERDRLTAAGGLYSGGARDEDGAMVIRAGCKGRCGIRLTVTAGEKDNHSKWAAVLPSASWRLIAALASLRDGATGEVFLEGFQDGVIGPDGEDEAALARLHFDRSAFLDQVGYGRLLPDAEFDPLRSLMFEPTFNIAWLGAGPGGGTVLPGSASALLDIRLVPGQTTEAMFALVRDHLARRGFSDVELRAEGGGDPDKCDLADPVVRALHRACDLTTTPYSVHPMGAGSGPRHLFRRHLGYSLVQDPGCSWQGSNDHAANENIMISHFYENRDLIERFLIAYGELAQAART